MDKLRCMEVFVTVIDAGNFTAAAEKLNISSVMVGKHVRQLEENLATRLLQRSTRRQSMTEAGALYYESARTVLEQVRKSELSIENMQSEPSGLLRVSAPVTLGSCLIAPLLPAYLAGYPKVQLEFLVSNVRVDLIEEGFDMAIRMGPLADSELVARPLPPYRMMICASPEYLRRAGTPQSLADLASHSCLSHQVWHGRHAWQLDERVQQAWPVRPVLVSNDGHALRAAAVHGAGLILQPEVLLAEDIAAGRLVPVLESFLPAARQVNIVYLADRRPQRKLKSFVDYLLGALGSGGA
jgi:DNA-binding transcriptional LysR family regulator